MEEETPEQKAERWWLNLPVEEREKCIWWARELQSLGHFDGEDFDKMARKIAASRARKAKQQSQT